MKNKTLQLSILRPGGNDTALIAGIPPKGLRKKINDGVMRQFPFVEQVGFYGIDPAKKQVLLEMAGGEFCGNATRSLAYLLLNGKKGKLQIKVSGTKQILSAGVNEPLSAYAQMPIKNSFSSVTELNKDLTKVEIEGITHLITNKPKNTPKKDLKTIGRNLLKQYSLLLSSPASGVMFVSTSRGLAIDPIVWVRDIQTLFYETACASGTTAVGLWRSKCTDKKKLSLTVKQPSGMIITVTVQKTDNRFESSWISGPIEIVKEVLFRI